MLPKFQCQDGVVVNVKHILESLVDKFNAVVDELDDLKKRIAAFENPPQRPLPVECTLEAYGHSLTDNPQAIGNFVVDQLQGTAALSTVSIGENKEDAVDSVPSRTRGKK